MFLKGNKKIIERLFQKDKKTLILMMVAVATILLLLIGATYAYFAAQAGGGTGADLNVATGTTDSLSFSVGKDINLHVTLDDFLEGMESPHGETTATATLKANNVTNQATGRYNVFFIIDNNNFEYSTEDGRTELLMKVTDPNGNEVMDITGLKRVEGGFDITTRTGGFLIMADYDIEATPTKPMDSQTWKLEVTFVNLDADQNVNKGKALNGRFYITTEKESTYELAKINAIDATTTYSTIDATLNYTIGSSEIDKYYYAIEEDTSGIAYLGAGVSVAKISNLAINPSDYEESSESTYLFDNLKPSTKYKIYSYAVDKYGVNSNVYETTITTKDYELAEVKSIAHTETLTSITITATAEGGSNEVSLYYFSKDNGVTWSEGQKSNIYTFDDLLDTTEYKIKVKVSDEEGIYSTEYFEAISTVTYIIPSVTTVEATKTYNSISLTTTAAGGTNSVANYYYKVGDGEWSEAQTTSAYNITNLTENTKYTIYVKVEDNKGRFSNEYTLDVTTNTYEVPSVSATISKTSNSITIDATGTSGDGTIVKYMYSKDGGSNWKEIESTSLTDSYTFENLTHSAVYQIRVKVVDNNNRESSEYATPATTDGINFILLSSFEITGADASLTNLIKDGSFENDGMNWDLSGAEVVSSQHSHGSKAIQFNPHVTAMSIQRLDYNAPTLNHYYYGRLKFLSNDNFNTVGGRYEWIYNDDAQLGSLLTFGDKTLKTSTWMLMSNILPLVSDAYLSYDWIARNFQVNADSYSYADELMIIDLTVSYGANIPSKETMDHLMYFGGTKSIKTINSNVGSFNVNGINTSNSYISCENGNGVITDNTVTITGTGNTENVVCRVDVIPTINEVNISNPTTTGFTITANVSASGSDIVYYYSIDNGTTWQSSTTNVYTYNNLGAGTAYNVIVKVVDSNGRESTIYSTPVTTNKETPTFTVSNTTSTIDASSMTSIVSYTYNGDGVVSCTPYSPSTATYASCSVNTLSKTITFTRIAAGTQSFIISASEGTNYLAGTSQTVTVTVKAQGTNFATYIKSLYTSQGSNGIYYHTSSLANGAEDNSYRYAGANPNNYVCFGSDAATCPVDNLYRIIGIFGNQVKLIKATAATISQLGTASYDTTYNYGFYWSGSSSNYSSIWSESTLNTEILNGTYLSGLGITWSNMIAITTWYVGGISINNGRTSNAKTTYNYEVGANKKDTTYSSKVGLMYVSEYYYAASPTYWTYPGYASSGFDYGAATSSNWMYMGGWEWTISSVDMGNYLFGTFFIGDTGKPAGNNPNYARPVRPVFFLDSSAFLTSGTGTQSDPYRIS